MKSALPILLLSSIVAFPKTAAIFDHDGRPNQNLTKAIEQAGYDVKPAAPKDLDAINQFDLLVIPNPQRFPAEKFPAIAQILCKKKTFSSWTRPFRTTHALATNGFNRALKTNSQHQAKNNTTPTSRSDQGKKKRM